MSDHWPDIEQADVCVFKGVVARKAYVCCENGCSIDKGEQYHRAKILYEKRWESYATCMKCYNLRVMVENKMFCSSPFGRLNETLREYFEDRSHDIEVRAALETLERWADERSAR